jgi:hypothetical protein
MLPICSLSSNRDRVKDAISVVLRRLSRTYEESRAQFDRIEDLVEAYEMGMGMVPGSEQGGTMRTFVRIQLGSEHLREFANQDA